MKRESENKKNPVGGVKGSCESCEFYDYDEESDQYVCFVNLDQDEMADFVGFNTESARVLRDFVIACECGVGVNLDPANFVMVTRQDPVEAVELLGEFIVHTHAKDGRMIRAIDPERIYGCFNADEAEPINVSDYFIETPLGEGQVDFPAYLGALRKAGFDGYLTVERETGLDPTSDIILARDMIKKLIVL